MRGLLARVVPCVPPAPIASPRLAWAPGLLLVAACAGEGGNRSSSGSRAGAPAVIRTAAAPADACGWISSTEVEQVLGPLAGQPTVVHSVERFDPDSSGSACRYEIAARPRVGTGAIVIAVDLSGGIIEEQVGGNMLQGFREMAKAGTPAQVSPDPEPERPPPGWDRVDKLWTGYSTFKGRIGHLAVSALALTPEITSEQTGALAARVRDAIPDLPFPLPPDPELEALARAAGVPDESPSGPDPCGLIPAAEAEAVLGKLIVPPYRSADNSPLATPYGTSCSYFTAGHRVLVVRPHWDTGRVMFGMARGLGSLTGSVVRDDTVAAADTLEGPWEEAAANGMTGQLYFLKGDRMLEMGYLTSSADRAGAVRLARTAVGQL